MPQPPAADIISSRLFLPGIWPESRRQNENSPPLVGGVRGGESVPGLRQVSRAQTSSASFWIITLRNNACGTARGTPVAGHHSQLYRCSCYRRSCAPAIIEILK